MASVRAACLLRLAALAALAAAAPSATPGNAPQAPLLLQRHRGGARSAAAAREASGAAAAEGSAAAAAAAASAASAARGQSAAERAKLPKDPSFFDSFTQGESTYDVDGDAGFTSGPDGWEPTLDSPYKTPGTDSEWFHESNGGSSHVAWQTHYPALQTGLAGRATTLGEWVQASSGKWVQEYVPMGNTRVINHGKMKLPAKWYDNSINQLDGFGRPKFPSSANPQRLLGWLEQAANTTMSCSSPGCIASVALQAFDGEKLKAKFCRLSIFVQHYSGNSVEWMSVNGANVSSQCKVPANSCKDTDSKPLYPCLMELPLDKLISETGTLNISAKVLDTADANCTYQGDMLTAVPMVTCMVSRLQTNQTGAGQTNFEPTAQSAKQSSLASMGIRLKRRVATHAGQ